MGPSPLTPPPMFSRSAIYKALTIYTTTLLRSLADPGGAFDIPNAKCPPDRGSSDCVTGRPASVFSASPYSTSSSPQSSPDLNILARHELYDDDFTPPPSSPSSGSFVTDFSPVAPRGIPIQRTPVHDLATPPLTPDSDAPRGSGVSGISARQSADALDFLSALFPRSALSALPFAKSVSISSPEMGGTFDGFVLELPGKPKTLYVDGKGAENVQLRESIVALLDLADEHLQCQALVIALERSSTALGDLLHSLMYVGGSVVTKPPFPVHENYVLVGMEM